MTVEQDVAVSVLAVTNTVSQSGPFNGASRREGENFSL